MIKRVLNKRCIEVLAVLALMGLGIVARGLRFGAVPGGLNQDEAFAGYEAYSLLHYGMDSWGYSMPVYLKTWGSGMSALNTYLMIPILAIFGGLESWMIRLPQLIVSCFTMFVFYKLLRKLFGMKAALLGLLFLAICPWHIMISRWGLDCNLAPGFLLFGFWFFLCGIDNAKYYMLSALFYGLSLYCYALLWLIVPLMLVLQLCYLLYVRKFQWNRYVGISIGILGVLALPLMLFLLVNMGVMEEIRTPVFSVPKLTIMRQGELSIRHIGDNLQNLFHILYRQNDGLYTNAPNEYGLYYRWTPLWGILGFGWCLRNIWCSFRKRVYDPVVLLMVPFLGAVILGSVNYVDISRINCIFLPIILFITMGMILPLRWIDGHIRYARHLCWVPVVIFLLLCFNDYRKFYFRTYGPNLGVIYQDGLGEAVERAMELAEDDTEIYVDFAFSKILFYSRLPVTEYLETVQYGNCALEFIEVNSCGQFHFGFQEPAPGNIYIIDSGDGGKFLENGWQVEEYGYTAVAY